MNKLIISIIILTLLFVPSCAPSAKKPRIGAARFSPDGQHLVFSIEEENGESIYRIRKDGNDLKRLTFAKGRDSMPAYSSDGSKIVFSSSESMEDGVPASLYIMDPDGSNQRRLTFGNLFDNFPVFSSDGKVVYFVRSRWYGRHSNMVHPFWQDEDIYSINIDDSGLRAITDGHYKEISPLSVFPDGNKILAKICMVGKSCLVWAIPLKDPERMESLPIDIKKFLPFWLKTHLNPYDPQLSPDGKGLLFVWSSDFKYDLYKMCLSDASIRKITNLGSYILYPSFSKDGKEIVFLLDPRRNGNHELWIVNSDGTNLHRVNIDLQAIKFKNRDRHLFTWTNMQRNKVSGLRS